MKIVQLGSVFLLLVLLNSCSIQKRDYLPGYHVTWNSANPFKGKNQQQIIDNQTFVVDEYDLAEKSNLSVEHVNSFHANNDNLLENDYHDFSSSVESVEDLIPFKSNSSVQNSSIFKNYDCDVITMRNGNDIRAKVLEVGISEVKYKDCGNLEGPTFTIAKKDVFLIKYANGSKTVFENEPQYTENTRALDEVDYSNTFFSGDKSFLLTAVFWFFLGLLGVHRFYLGYTGLGILYLCTGALCGIGWIIDGIQLLMGTLKPRRGKYIDTQKD